MSAKIFGNVTTVGHRPPRPHTELTVRPPASQISLWYWFHILADCPGFSLALSNSHIMPPSCQRGLVCPKWRTIMTSCLLALKIHQGHTTPSLPKPKRMSLQKIFPWSLTVITARPQRSFWVCFSSSTRTQASSCVL